MSLTNLNYAEVQSDNTEVVERASKVAIKDLVNINQPYQKFVIEDAVDSILASNTSPLQLPPLGELLVESVTTAYHVAQEYNSALTFEQRIQLEVSAG